MALSEGTQAPSSAPSVFSGSSGNATKFVGEVLRIDRRGGDVHVRLLRPSDGASVILQVSPAGRRSNVLARTPFGDVSYTRFSAMDERLAGRAARRYAALLETDALALAARYPHLLGAHAGRESLARLLGTTTAASCSEMLLDPAGVVELLSPEIVPDGPPFAGHVLRAVHWLADLRACLLDFEAAGTDNALAVIVGPAASLSDAFGVAGALALEVKQADEVLGDCEASFAAHLLALLLLKQEVGFSYRVPEAAEIPSVPIERTPRATASGAAPVPPQFSELRRFTDALLAAGAFRSAAGITDTAAPPSELADLGRRLRAERQRLDERIACAVRSEREAIEADGLLLDGAAPPELAIPHDYADAVAVAALVERLVPDSPFGRALDDMYLDSIPRKWMRQLRVRSEPNVRLLHSPVDWERLPRLRRMVESLYAQTESAGGSAVAYLGAPSARQLFASARTIADLYEGSYWSRFMPLQDLSPVELAGIAGHLAEGADVEPALDRFLSPPLFHDLSHGRTARIALHPPNLDECVTAYLGVRAAPEILLPDPGEENGLHVIGWYSQVGQALARIVGWKRLVRAYTGVESWVAVLSPGLARAFVRLGWEDYFQHRHPSFQPRVYRPDAWLKLFFLSAAGADLEELHMARLEALPWSEIAPPVETPLDAEIVRDGLRAMCVHHFLRGEWMRVGRRVPARPIAIDLDSCRMSTESAANAADPAPPAYLFPPSIAARLRTDGVEACSLVLRDLDAIPEAAAGVVEGKSRRTPAFDIELTTRRDRPV
jgi:hypothetical protein